MPKRKLIRVGECNRCGLCCVGCGNYISPNICSVWETQPEDKGCKIWPPHPFERPDYCNYHFYDSETFDEVVGWHNRALIEIYEPLFGVTYGY